MLENFKDDWRTYDGDLLNPGLWVMAVYRFGRWRYTIPWSWLRKPFSLSYKLAFAFVRAATGAEIPCEAQIGKGLRIEHSHGIVISGDATLGEAVILRNGVTIGLRRTGHRGSPTIGDRADIGAGAKILGPICIGSDVSIGANAVVLKDVPSGSIAVGVPARILPRSARDFTPQEIEEAMQTDWLASL